MFQIRFTDEAQRIFDELEHSARTLFENRARKGKKKASRQEGLFKQVNKTIDFLGENPRHPSLRTHPYESLSHPWNLREKVFEAYAQQNTPAAYRVFWCYGPEKGDITILAITAHP